MWSDHINPGHDINHSHRPTSCWRQQVSEKVTGWECGGKTTLPPTGFNIGYTRWLISAGDDSGVCFNDLTQYLTVDRFLKASSHMSILTVVRSGMSMTIHIHVRVWVSAAMLIGGLMSIPRLGALLHRVSSLCGNWPLPRLDPSYLVDVDFGLWRVLNVDVDQGWVERHWRRDTQFIRCSGNFE